VPFICLLVDVGVRREHLVQIVEAALVNGGGIVNQQLLDLQAIGNFGQAQHASIQHRGPTQQDARSATLLGLPQWLK
jgi:hypothetical protein